LPDDPLGARGETAVRVRNGVDGQAVGASTPLGRSGPRRSWTDYVEAVWIIEGHGRLHDRDNDVFYELKPGTMYLLDKHERHTMIADTQLRMYCVFAPAVPPGSDQELPAPPGPAFTARRALYGPPHRCRCELASEPIAAVSGQGSEASVRPRGGAVALCRAVARWLTGHRAYEPFM
jgi:hypothetical protein